MVDIELTAQPILQIVSKMAADAITDIESKAFVSGTTNIRDFNWTDIAKQSITKAEADARNMIMNLIGPIAEDAFAKVKAADEAEAGTEVMIPEEDRNLVRTRSAVSNTEVEQSILEAIAEEPAQEDGDAEMIDADTVVDSEKTPAPVHTSTDQVHDAADPQDSATPTAEGQDDYWTGTCYCEYGDVFGDRMIACEGKDGQACRHGWFHADCLNVVLYKEHLPTDQPWQCPYCGDYGVKAKMMPATMMKKPAHLDKIKLCGQPMLPGY